MDWNGIGYGGLHSVPNDRTRTERPIIRLYFRTRPLMHKKFSWRADFGLHRPCSVFERREDEKNHPDLTWRLALTRCFIHIKYSRLSFVMTAHLRARKRSWLEICQLAGPGFGFVLP